MSRPLAWIAVALLAGTLAGAWHLLPGIALPFGFVFLACLLSGFATSTPRIRPIVIALCFIGVGASLWNIRDHPRSDVLSDYLAQHAGADIQISGIVRNTQIVLPDLDDDPQRRSSPHQVLIVDVDHVHDKDLDLPIAGRTIVYWYNSGSFCYPGQRVDVAGKGRVAIATVNFGVRGYEDYLRNWGIQSAIDCAKPTAVMMTAQAQWYNPWYWAARVRQHQADRLTQVMPRAVLPFIYAVWLGQQNAIHNDEYQTYIGSGTAHILSVSGVHAGIVFLTLNFVLRLLQLQRKTRAILAMAGVFSFALIAGASVPAMRAAIMVSLYLLADVLDREPDTPTALSLAGILFILRDPRAVFDTGFLLSFLCIASILLYQPLFVERLHRAPRVLRATLATSFSVQILPLPVVAANFHILSLVAPITNIFAILLLTGLLWLCFVASLLSYVWMPAARVFGYATWLPIYLIRQIAFSGAYLNHFVPAVTSPTPLAAALYWFAAACLAALFVCRMNQRRYLKWTAAILAILAFAVWRPRDHTAEIVHLDVGNGDAAFIRTTTGDTMVIDGGWRDDKRDAGQQIVAPFLWARGITRLDAVMVSHADTDHIGGLIYIIDNFNVDTAILGILPGHSELEERFLRRCEARGTRVIRVKRGDALTVGHTTMSILHPSPDGVSRTSRNNGSIVTRIPFGNSNVLFTGDIEKVAESEIAGELTHVDILKVPHHGSNTSSSTQLIDAVAPRFAVISAAPKEKGVMDAEIIERYAARPLNLFRTDRHGAVRFTLHDGTIEAESARVQRAYPIAKE